MNHLTRNSEIPPCAPRLLITGFEPFDGEACNPTQEIIMQLRAAPPPGMELITAVLPVATHTAPQQLCALLQTHQPGVALLMGLARGRATLSLEQVAINMLDFSRPDNTGEQIQDQTIIPGAPAAYFTTLPVRAMLEQLSASGIPAIISYTAGAYLCNQVFFTALHWAANEAPATRIGFLHTPVLPAQSIHKDTPAPSMA